MSDIEIKDTRKKGFFIVDNEMIDLYAQLLGPIGFSLYALLCRHADKNQEAFPSQETMLTKLGMKDRETVSKYLKVMESHKLIKIEKTTEKGTGKFLHNTYTLLDKSVWNTMPDQTRHGHHARFDPTWVEAKSMPDQTDTNKTHVLTKPIKGVDPIVQSGLLNEEVYKKVEARHEKQERKGSRPSYSTQAPSPRQPYMKKERRIADGRHIL